MNIWGGAIVPEVSKEHIGAIVKDILEENGVSYYDRISSHVGLYFCKYKGINFNIKVKRNGQVEAWTYSEKQVPQEMRLFVLELLNAFQSSNHEIHAYINEDNRIIFKRSFTCIERDALSEQAISSNMDVFFKNTIHHKHLSSRLTQD